MVQDIDKEGHLALIQDIVLGLLDAYRDLVELRNSRRGSEDAVEVFALENLS